MDTQMILAPNTNDISSYGNFDKMRQEHIDIDSFLDFEKKTLSGHVLITFKVLDHKENKIVLDVKGLKITSAQMDGKQLKWHFYSKNQDKDALGTPLVIEIEPTQAESIKVKIGFICDENCGAIKFLDKSQTKNKTYPFMYTQCEAIQCRSLIPCQDSPSAKVTVHVKVSVESPMTVLFSGLKVKDWKEDKLTFFEYEQKIPIPTYLIAFASGELEHGKISERCGVWTEVGLKEQAVKEFESAETFLKAAETYLTPYRWGVYDILVLPFPFPYGGMENPCLTFVTPALLAGDGSMANVIAHEIAHSWTGNLVTNKDWGNFWVNEGFTTFMERKLSELVFGEDMANLEAQVGVGELKADIEIMGIDSSYTSLCPDYSGVDPDDGFSTVPYEKGFTFIYFLESLVGKKNFQSIMQAYITEFALKSVDYTAFRGVFERMVKDIYKEKANEEVLSKIEWEKWVNSKGQPLKTFEFKTKYIQEAEGMAEDFIQGKHKDKFREVFKKWHTNSKIVFLNYLNNNLTKVTKEVYGHIRDILQLHGNYNAEVKYLWNSLALSLKQEDSIPYVKEFLLTHGRLKYIRPVYYEFYRYNYGQANEFFTENKHIYHQFAMRIIDDKFTKWNANNGKTD